MSTLSKSKMPSLKDKHLAAEVSKDVPEEKVELKTDEKKEETV